MAAQQSINWTPVLINLATVIFAAGIVYAKVVSLEKEIEPGILKVADERTKNILNELEDTKTEVRELKSEIRDKTQGRFYRWEGDQLRKRIEALEEKLDGRVSP